MVEKPRLLQMSEHLLLLSSEDATNKNLHSTYSDRIESAQRSQLCLAPPNQLPPTCGWRRGEMNRWRKGALYKNPQ